MAEAFTRAIIRQVRQRGGGNVQRTRALLAYTGGGISIALNVLLFSVKLSVGIMIGSISVTADALHTGTDVLTSVVVLWGFWAAGKPADEEHPFGHGRMEYIVALIIAVLLCVAGIELIKHAVGRLGNAPQVGASASVVVFLAATAAVKEWMARFSFAVSREIDSTVLKADGWHHRSDAVSTTLVIVAMLGAMAGIHVLDSVVGMAVAAYIIYAGWDISREAATYLLGRRTDTRVISDIQHMVAEMSGVEGAHDIVVHDYGAHKAISLHVEVDPGINACAAHAIAQAVEERIAERVPSSPIVHIDLSPGSRVREAAAVRSIDRIRRRYDVIHGFHGVRLSSTEQGNTLRLHVVVPQTLTIAQTHRLEHRFSKDVRRVLPGYSVNVHIEPCVPTCPRCREQEGALSQSNHATDTAA